METKYPTLRRPKRKLCYLTNKESVSNEWAGKVTLGDVDKMFDDLDSFSHGDGLCPLSPVLQTPYTLKQPSDGEVSTVSPNGQPSKNPPSGPKGPAKTDLLPATKSTTSKSNIDSDIPFEVHGPVKTSSPIEKNVVVENVEEVNEQKQPVSPILYDCQEEENEKAMTEPLTNQKPESNGIDDSELQSPPRQFALSKPTISSHKNKVDRSCKESHLAKEESHKKPETPVLHRKRNTPRQEDTDKPVRHKPELVSPEKPSTSFHSHSLAEVTCLGKDRSAFLQKLRDAGKPRPARKLLTPVKVSPPPPPPPEQEDDFLILDDNEPVWFTIPSKTATSKRQKKSESSSTDKDSSTDKGSTQEPAQKEEESPNGKTGMQPINLKKKRKTGKEKKNELTEPVNDKDELTRPEDVPAVDLMEQEKTNKKKKTRLKKSSSKESEKPEEEPRDTAGRETDKENPSQEMEKKAQKNSEMKKSRASKEDKTSRAKSLKRSRKVMQGPEDTEEVACDNTVHYQSEDQNNEIHADVDLGSLPDKQSMDSIAETSKESTEGKAKPDKLTTLSQEGSPEEGQILGKRRRRPTGQWWLSGAQSPEETDVTEGHATLKKSKRHKKEPRAAGRSPGKAQKVLKKRNRTQPSPSSSRKTVQSKEKKIRTGSGQIKNRPERGDTANKIKARDDAFNTHEVEEMEDRPRELEPEHSSPLEFTHRDLSLNSGDQVFQKVYHVSNEKMSDTATPGRRLQQLKRADAEKRRRKPPGDWWAVHDGAEEVESTSSPPRPLTEPKEPKPREDRKKQSKQSRALGLGTSKSAKVPVSSKPVGGAHVPPLKLNPTSPPKSVKRSLAIFKDIFTSASKTPAVVRSRHTAQDNGCGVSAGPAEEVTDCATHAGTEEDLLSVEARELRRLSGQGVPQDGTCNPEHTSKDLRSGPSSMIEVEQYENSDDLIVPPSRVFASLQVSDLCSPPLKPLILQPKDKANLTEWFKSLWSPTVDSCGEITPDHFDWYFYQGRAMGFLVDLNCGSVCNGKILLGSYMKKPLWVDHSASTVFNLLTSSVSVTIDGKESRFNPGQSFMVQCGHAYSIHNTTAQPAVLYFTRILTEGSD